MSSPANKVLYEVRVLLDGICTAGTLFNQDPSWPQVIDTSFRVDRANDHDQLRFPPFHAEMLTQVWADASQNLGRIKIIMAEGIQHGHGNPSFQRLKNIVAFSFLHAPLHILENCCIAWPNPGMWLQVQQQFHNVSLPRPEPADTDAHAHSPRRRDASLKMARTRLDALMGPPPNAHASTTQPATQICGVARNDPFWSQHGPSSDPFIGGVNFNSFYNNLASRNTTGSGDVIMRDKSGSTSSSHDMPMPDASRPLSPASSRLRHSTLDSDLSMSASRILSVYAVLDDDVDHLTHAINGEKNVNTTENPHNEQFNDMIASFSPLRRDSGSGISAPSNTRASSVANTPPGLHHLLKSASEAGTASYEDHNRAVPVTTRDPPPPYTRVSYTVKPSDSPDGEKKIVETTIKKKPVGRPRGRKEGNSSEQGLEISSRSGKRPSAGSVDIGGKEITESEDKIGTGKRKRANEIAGSKVALEDRVENPDLLSPTRKFSKTGPHDSASPKLGDMDELTAEGVVTRRPLREIDNIL